MTDVTADDAVLVVDDDEHIRNLCRDLFAEYSTLDVHTADDVDAAAAVLEDRDDVRCVVCDYVLPDESGVDFVRSLRDDGDDRPFVLLTGNGSEDVVDAAFDAGVDDYFRKGGTSNDRVLVQRVENLIERRDAQRSLDRERERFQTLIEASSDLITILDDAGRYRYVSPAAERVLGYEPEELLGENAFRRIHPDDRERVFERFDDVITAPESSVESLEYRYRTGDDDYRWFESTGESNEVDAIGGYVVNTRDVTERKHREQALEALNDAMRDLITVDDGAAIADILAETPERVTSATNAAYYGWDDETGSLRLRAHTWTSDPLPDEIRGDSPVWDGFVAGATTRVGADAEADRSSLPVDATCGLVVPVGSEGALLCVSHEAFDGDDVHVAELFAAGCQAAFDRTEYRDVLERKERELDDERERLAHAQRINDVVRGVDQVLVRSADRSAVARSVCRELVAADFVEMAWFGVRTDDGLEALDWAGGDDGFLEQVLAHANDIDRAPARVAFDTQEPVHVTSVLDDDRCAGIRRPALNRGYRSVLSVPLDHRGTNHGVLELYGTDPGSFTEHDLAVFEELGDVIGYACSTIDRRDAVVTDAVVEVEVSLSDVDDSLSRAAAAVDAPVTVTDVVSKPDRYLVYLETDADAALRDRLDDQRAVDDVAVLSDARVEARVSEFPLVAPLREYAGEFVHLEVDAAGASLVVRLPGRVDVRTFVDDLASLAADAELARKEVVTADANSVAAFDLERHLTDRQREVLVVAYNHGFFTWPRGSTGKEVAASLDISAPTFHQHIRKATNRIVALALQREPTDGDPSTTH